MNLQGLTYDNFSLLIIASVVASMTVLAVMVLTSDRRNASNVLFALFCLAAVGWSILNYISFTIRDPALAFWVIRAVIATGVWFVTFLYLFLSTFPNEQLAYTKRKRIGLFSVATLVSVLCFTPLIFREIGSVRDGLITTIINGPGIFVYGLYILGCVIGGVYVFFRKLYGSAGDERSLLWLVLSGMIATFSALMIFNLILPAFFDNASYIKFGALFIFPLIACISVALLNFKFLNSKAVGIGILTALLSIVVAVEVGFSPSLLVFLFRIGEFTFVLGIGVLLIRQVVLEANQREVIERQEKELEVINVQQESLLHFISHEIKGYLTKGQNAFAGIVEGDYGETSPAIKAIAAGALHEMRKGVSTVMDILDASNYKKGTMTFDKKAFDIKKSVLELSDELRFMAEEKGLRLEITFAPSGDYIVVGDETKLRRHVLRNLIENSIRYTPNGKVVVSLSRVDAVIRFKVTDTGVGISDEDKLRLFTQGGKGKDSLKFNVDSTGYGLFVAKQVTDAHGGKISAYSEGAGKGATFTVDLPST